MGQASKQDRIVWADIPVSDLKRASKFYSRVLAIEVTQESFEGSAFAVLAHGAGSGACLIIKPEDVTEHGPLIYWQVEGRLADAVQQACLTGGQLLEPAHPIGPHGWRAIVRDSEGNRLALHSEAAP